MKEWHRTILLILLIAVAIGYIIWSQNLVDSNFTDSFR